MKKSLFGTALELNNEIEAQKLHIQKVKNQIAEIERNPEGMQQVALLTNNSCERWLPLSFDPLKTLKEEQKRSQAKLKTLEGQFAKL